MDGECINVYSLEIWVIFFPAWKEYQTQPLNNVKVTLCSLTPNIGARHLPQFSIRVLNWNSDLPDAAGTSYDRKVILAEGGVASYVVYKQILKF